MMTKTVEILGFDVAYKVWYNRNDTTQVDDVEILSSDAIGGDEPEWSREIHDEYVDDDYQDADDKVIAQLEAAIYDLESEHQS